MQYYIARYLHFMPVSVGSSQPIETESSNDDNTDNSNTSNTSVVIITILAVLFMVSVVCVIVLTVFIFKLKMQPQVTDDNNNW